MSYLALLRVAEARLRAIQPTHETNELTNERPSSHVAKALAFLGMSLNEFARRGASLQVRVPWLDVTLWMVPGDRDADGLTAEGVLRGRIWTASELMQLIAIADRTSETVNTVAHAKLELDGEITEVRIREL
jgi:hypothetical protein